MIPAEYAGQERRRGQRAAAHVPVRIAQEDGDVVTETLNISRSGAYCRVNTRIELMTKLKIQILLPSRKNQKRLNKTIHCRGVVVRVEPAAENGRFEIAIFFNEIAQRDAESINDYVGSCWGRTMPEGGI